MVNEKTWDPPTETTREVVRKKTINSKSARFKGKGVMEMLEGKWGPYVYIYIYIMYIQLSETLPQTSDVMSKHLAFFFRFFDSRSGDPKRISYTVSKTRPANQGQQPSAKPSGPVLARTSWAKRNGFLFEPNRTQFLGAGRGVKWSFLPSGQRNVIKRLVGILVCCNGRGMVQKD